MPIHVAATLREVFPGSAGWSRRRTYDGTSQGAELWASTDGQLVIVKHHRNATPDRFAAVVRRIQTLRDAGVPAPATRFATHGPNVLLIHDYLPGRSDPELTPGLVTDLVDVVKREAGLADDSAAEWSTHIEASLTVGLDGYNEHRSLQTFSADSRALLRRVRQVGRDRAVGQLRAPDLVHYDLHSVNVISADGHSLSGIIDWDAVRAGDRALDLANLAFTSLWKTSDPAVYEQLWHAFLSSSSHDARVVYLHHVVLRQIDWVIRHPGLPPGPERTIELGTWALDVAETGRFTPPPSGGPAASTSRGG